MTTEYRAGASVDFRAGYAAGSAATLARVVAERSKTADTIVWLIANEAKHWRDVGNIHKASYWQDVADWLRDVSEDQFGTAAELERGAAGESA